MPTHLRQLKLREISLVKRGANPGARVVLFKSEEAMNPLQRVVGSLRQAFATAITKQAPDGTILKSAEEQLAAVDEQLEEFVTAIGEAEPIPVHKEEDVPQTREDILKALPDAARQLVEKAESDAAAAAEIAKAAKERADAAEAEVKKAAEATADAERIKLAKELLGDKIAGKPEELAAILKALDAPQTAALTQILKSAVAVGGSATPITEPIGKKGKDTTPADELSSKAAEIRKAQPHLTQPQAIQKALEENPTLYDATVGASA